MQFTWPALSPNHQLNLNERSQAIATSEFIAKCTISTNKFLNWKQTIEACSNRTVSNPNKSKWNQTNTFLRQFVWGVDFKMPGVEFCCVCRWIFNTIRAVDRSHLFFFISNYFRWKTQSIRNRQVQHRNSMRKSCGNEWILPFFIIKWPTISDCLIRIGQAKPKHLQFVVWLA